MSWLAWLCVALWAGGAMGWAAVFKNDRETPAATWVVAALWPGWLLCFVAASCVGLGGLFRREGGPYDGNRR